MAAGGAPRFDRLRAGTAAIGHRMLRMEPAMSTPRDVPELTFPQDVAVDEAEAARCLEVAARMVQEFSAAGTSNALKALLAVATEAPATAAERAVQLAETVIDQTTTLHNEVRRYLSVTRET
jgi:hypothetical protein